MKTREIALVARQSFGQPLVVEVFFLTGWNICLLCDGKIFRGIRPSFFAWRCNFVDDVTRFAHMIKARHGELDLPTSLAR